MRNCIFVLPLIMAALAIAACSGGHNSWQASHKNIVVSGRHIIQPSGAVAYDFPGVLVRIRFRGTGVDIRMHDTSNYFNVIVDNQFHKVLKGNGNTRYTLAEGLQEGTHQVAFIKRTEAEVGATLINKVWVSEGGKLLQANEKPRRIEVIGNSISCGYGTEASSKATYSPATQDAYDSYAAFLADTFNTDLSIVAYSGKGVVRNYGDKAKRSALPMPALYNRALVSQPKAEWNFSNQVPDMVIINLGTNDFSTKPHPDKSMFVPAYKRLLKRVHEHYPGVPVVGICGPLMKPPACAYIHEAIAGYGRKSQETVKFVKIPSALLQSSEDFGADGHPSRKGQQKMAGFLFSEIQALMKWKPV